MAAEEKITWKQEEFGGWDIEAKWKNDGSVSYDVKSDALKQTEVDGLQDAKLTFEGKANRKSTGWPTVGFKWSNKDFDVHAKSPLENPLVDFGLIYRHCNNNTFAVQKFVRTDAQDTFFRLGWGGQWQNTGIRWAFSHQAKQAGNMVSTNFTDGVTQCWAQAHNGNNTVNGGIDYNWTRAVYASTLGLRLK